VIAYIEYFGIQRIVLCLNSNYEGEAITSTYSINPITGEELDLEIDLNLSNAEVHQAYSYEKFPTNAMEEAFHAVMPTAIENAYEKERDRVLDKALSQAFSKCKVKEGQLLTHEDIQDILDDVLIEIKPFIVHNLAKINLDS